MNAIIKKRLSFRYGYYTKNIGSAALIVLAFFQANYSNISTSSVLFTEAEKKVSFHLCSQFYLHLSPLMHFLKHSYIHTDSTFVRGPVIICQAL